MFSLWIPKYRDEKSISKGTVSYTHLRNFSGQIKSVTISQVPSGKYYVSILVETEHTELPHTNQNTGIDLGIKELCITSDGKKYENPKIIRKYEKKLKKPVSYTHLGQLMELVRNVKADRPGFELFVTLPTILRSYSEPYLKRLSGQVKAYDGLVDGFLAGSLGGMCWVTEKYPEKKLSLQHSCLLYTSRGLKFRLQSGLT